MEVTGCIKAEPMTIALTLQFMNGLGHSLASVEYVLYIPLDGFSGQRQGTASGSIPGRGQ